MGFEVIVLDPDPMSPAGRIATRHIARAYTDQEALIELGRHTHAVTTEFENVPAASLAFLRQFVPVRPGAEAVLLTQDRLVEKRFAQEQGLGTAPFHPVQSLADCDAAFAVIGAPALLKTARLGYDGKGQASVDSLEGVRDGLPAVRRAALHSRGPAGARAGDLGDPDPRRGWRDRHLPSRREPARQRHPGYLGRARPGEPCPGRRGAAARLRCWRMPWSTSAPWRSSSLWWTVASCSSTRWRPGRTTAGTTPWTPAPPTSSSSRCGRWRGCRSATPGCCHRSRW